MNAQISAVPGAQVGERVILRQSSSGDKDVRGVLLPPAQPDGPHRIHGDEGNVVQLVGTWLAAPERSAADRKKDRRRQYCDDGRPIYRCDDLPARQLATRTMLSARRRRPAEGQEPIASYKVYKGYAPLYAVIDTNEMPPLPPGRRAAWITARTCARCEATQERPFSKGPDGARYCGTCQEPAAREHWGRQRHEGRKAATSWARDVLGGTNVVLLKARTYEGSFAVRAETLGGAVLVDAEVRDPRSGPVPDWLREQVAGRYTPIDPVVKALCGLEGRRLVTWRDGLKGLVLTVKRYADVDLPLTTAEQAAPHYDEWIAQHCGMGPRGYRHNQRLALQKPPTGWDSEVAGIRAALHAMATDWPPLLFADEQETEADRG